MCRNSLVVLLTVVPCVDGGQGICVLLSQLGKLVHQRPPLRPAELRPRTPERAAGSSDGIIYVFMATGVDLGDNILVAVVNFRVSSK